MVKYLKEQKGIGGLLIIGAVVFVILAIAVMVYFLFNSNKEDTAQPPTTGQTIDETQTIPDENVPLVICETGDPEQCHDPVSNSDVDNIQTIEED